MAKFTKEDIELLETLFDCEGFKEVINYNGHVTSIICNASSELSKQVFDVTNAYEQFEHYLKVLSQTLRKEGIETCY